MQEQRHTLDLVLSCGLPVYIVGISYPFVQNLHLKHGLMMSVSLLEGWRTKQRWEKDKLHVSYDIERK